MTSPYVEYSSKRFICSVYPLHELQKILEDYGHGWSEILRDHPIEMKRVMDLVQQSRGCCCRISMLPLKSSIAIFTREGEERKLLKIPKSRECMAKKGNLRRRTSRTTAIIT